MTTFTKPVTKFYWASNEPNNHLETIEDIIIAKFNTDMEWLDGVTDITLSSNLKC